MNPVDSGAKLGVSPRNSQFGPRFLIGPYKHFRWTKPEDFWPKWEISGQTERFRLAKLSISVQNDNHSESWIASLNHVYEAQTHVR